MKRLNWLLLVVLVVGAVSFGLMASEEEHLPWLPKPEEHKANSMHPKFKLLDKDGNPFPVVVHEQNQNKTEENEANAEKPDAQSNKAQTAKEETSIDTSAFEKKFSAEKTCGQCHNTSFINMHSTHNKHKSGATCINCHTPKGQLDWQNYKTDANGFVNHKFMDIKRPSNTNCARCHGLIHTGTKPMSIPDDFAENGKYTLTKLEGAIVSPRPVAESFMNVKGKEHLERAWDVHAMRGVNCIECHNLSNDPAKANRGNDLPFLTKDPRTQSISQFLKNPNHKLEASNCTECHNPHVIHDFLPYKERHFEKLECSACHVPQILAPAYRTYDETSVDPSGNPLVEYRGVSEGRDDLNTAYITGFYPPLMTKKVLREEKKLAPVNFVSHYFWKDGKTKKAVEWNVVKAAFMDEEGRYNPAILQAFDANKDGKLDTKELRLDTQAKVAAVKSRLEAVGVNKPEIEAVLESHEIHHGIAKHDLRAKECSECHSDKSRINSDVKLASYLPNGTKLVPKISTMIMQGKIVNSSTGLVLARKDYVNDLYVFGMARGHFSDKIGFLIFLLTLIGVSFHGGMRIYSSRKHPHPHVKTKKEYLYSVYERIWHWVMAISIILLLITGFEIHFYSAPKLFGLATSVWMHNVIAAILLINAALALFYHITTNEIRKFIPPKDNFFEEVISQIKFYSSGIFLGRPHPLKKTKDRKFNPLQQMTYFGLLNVLMPFQVITGVIIWMLGKWPELSAYFGPMYKVAIAHNFGAWLFLAFLVAHLYLITTGHTIFANLEAMITGYDDVEVE